MSKVIKFSVIPTFVNRRTVEKEVFSVTDSVESRSPTVMDGSKLQALVYDILPSGGRCRKAMLGVWDGSSPPWRRGQGW